MITFQKHIELQRIVESGGNIEALFHGLTDAEGHLLADDIEDSYPIVDNLLKPTFTKKIYYSVEEMVFGQFIMVEQILTGKMGMNNHTADLELAKLLIRPSSDGVFDNDDGHKELSNEEDILEYDVREIYYILERFTKRRNKTMFEDYSGVFYDPKEEEDDEDDPQADSGPNFHQQWYYYSLVRMLANEDITKYDDIYMLPMKSVLPEMSYLSQKRKIDDAESRKQSALAKMK
tara:strand:- start:21560 stop:22258 length:699 start_codon:yes stop_codon:yes gene_type:complete